ncbi:MAG: hypothetical protein NXI04_18230 [Planctomycetaceae bacterium]|nr:hypothetical protein [Planctomycetaceae bacterium]
MKDCKYCRHGRYVRRCASHSRWYHCLFFHRCVRCRYCGYVFLTWIWHRIPVSRRKKTTTLTPPAARQAVSPPSC